MSTKKKGAGQPSAGLRAGIAAGVLADAIRRTPNGENTIGYLAVQTVKDLRDAGYGICRIESPKGSAKAAGRSRPKASPQSNRRART